MTDPLRSDLIRLRRYLWVRVGIFQGGELADVMGSDLDALADEHFGPNHWTRGKVSTEFISHPPAEAPAPPTTTLAHLYVGWAYYQEVTPWWEKAARTV